ncbi:MAG: sensor histidine kinase [Bacteroidota bacterium]|jgi:two-component system NarL family sensor kinase|nr:hypothetical protein [Cytophagales bacterium]
MSIAWIVSLSIFFLFIGFFLGFQLTQEKPTGEYFRMNTRNNEAYPKKRVIPATKPKVEVNHEKTEVKQAIEDERMRLKFMLHDDTIQRLVAIKLRLEDLALAPVFSREKSNMLLEDIEHTILKLRFIIANMLDEEYEQKSISELLRNIENRYQRFINTKVMLMETNLEYAFDLTAKQKQEILLMVQEALQNTIKHAQSNQFHIYIDWHADGLTIETEDHAKAIDPYSTPGFGTKSLIMRAEAIGAAYTYRFLAAQGMVLHIDLPKSQHAIAQQKTH